MDGTKEIQDSVSLNKIQGLRNENIAVHNNIDMKGNNIFFGDSHTSYVSKIEKKTYELNGSSLYIPVEAKNDTNIYMINVSREDGIYHYENNNPIFVAYLMLSKVSFLPPISVISNQIDSYDYNHTNRVLHLNFSKNYTNLGVNVVLSHLL